LYLDNHDTTAIGGGYTIRIVTSQTQTGVLVHERRLDLVPSRHVVLANLFSCFACEFQGTFSRYGWCAYWYLEIEFLDVPQVPPFRGLVVSLRLFGRSAELSYFHVFFHRVTFTEKA
jgi:hypothetical protein